MIGGLPPVCEAETFGQRLRVVRRNAGLMLRQVAAEVGVDYTYLSKLENDRLPAPSQKTLERLAAVCGVLPQHLDMVTRRVPRSLKERAKTGPLALQALLIALGELDLTETQYAAMLAIALPHQGAEEKP